MKEVWAADCETDPFKEGRIPKPFVWGCYNGQEYHRFDRTEEFIDFITARDCIVYAHNGGRFDWHFVISQLDAGTPLTVIAGRIAKFELGNAEFRDSYNIIPVPLAAYQKDEMDYEIMEEEFRDIPENREKIEHYLKMDCVYLFELVDGFIERYGLHLTQAGAAMKIWEAMEGRKQDSTTPEFYKRFSPYYYGGRVEAFELGVIEDEFTVIDINSAYPYAMLSRHPRGDATVELEALPGDDEAGPCFIRLVAESHGAFPVRKDDGGLWFPADGIVREFTITGWEYMAARDTGALKVVEVMSVTKFTDSITFRPYVERFYSLKDESKQNGDALGYLFAKLFLNSLYGKYAANAEKYKEFVISRWSEINVFEEQGYAFTAPLDKWALMQRDTPQERQRFYNVATAASITGYVRAYLFRAKMACDGVMYCDTDSLAVRKVGELPMHPTELGAWDVEAECNLAAIGGKKMYAFHKKGKVWGDIGSWKMASKGVRLTPEEMIRVATGEEVGYTPIAPSFSVKRGIGFISRNVRRADGDVTESDNIEGILRKVRGNGVNA